MWRRTETAALQSCAGDDPLPEAITLMRLGRVLTCQRDLRPASTAFQQALSVLAHVDARTRRGGA